MNLNIKLKIKMGSGKGWSQKETLFACRAYLIASEDPRRGSNKKKETFSKAVCDEYQNVVRTASNDDSLTYVERSGEAICQRFRKARCECLKLEGLVKQVESRQPTGAPTDEDIERAALAVYNGEDTIGQMYSFLLSRTVDVGPEFPFKQALTYLRSTHTWVLLLQSQQDREKKNATIQQLNGQTANTGNEAQEGESVVESVTESPTPQTPSAPSDKGERPTGKKRALELSKQSMALHKGATAIDKLAEASCKRTKLAEEMLQVDKQRSLIQLFSMPDTNPLMKEKFMRLSQEKALDDLERQMRKKEKGDANINTQSHPPANINDGETLGDDQTNSYADIVI